MVRHTDAHTGGPGAIMFRDDMKPLEPDHFLYEPVRPHPRPGREGSRAWRLALGEAVGVDLPLAELALKNLAAGLGVPHSASTTKE